MIQNVLRFICIRNILFFIVRQIGIQLKWIAIKYIHNIILALKVVRP